MRYTFEMRNRTAGIALALVVAICLGAQQAAPPKFAITPDAQSALDHISADSLRGHLSFIASDLLQGRATPSPGLDMAAEYIAAQFRRAGVEPAGDDGYFQTANWLLAEQNLNDFSLSFQDKTETIHVSKDQVTFSIPTEFSLTLTAVFKVDFADQSAIAALTPEQVKGRAVLTEIPDWRRADGERRREAFQSQAEFRNRMAELGAALVVSVDRLSATGAGAGTGRLIDPENRAEPVRASGPPSITVHDPKLVKLYDAMKPGPSAATVTARVPAPKEGLVKLHNVIGILRGSDPALKDTCVLVTAHYDHVGMQPFGEGDRIFNGANDDGSGTVTVIELAATLAKLKQRPKRSIVFMAFFGEERGLLGSRYYARHPVFPIDKTVAHVNLEQVGRTDSSEGPQLRTASLTGFDFSDVGAIFKAAGELTGVNVYKHAQNSDAFFGRSDNQALADKGVPAHTLCVAYQYPDYHGLGDHWDKIDYANMEKVARMVGVGLLMIAESETEPKWNEANPKAARYLKAWKERRGAEATR